MKKIIFTLTVFLILAVTAGIAFGSCPICWFALEET